MRLALVGVVIGLVAAFLLSRLLAAFLFGVRRATRWCSSPCRSLLTAVALIAVWLPARRASKVNPILALRYE